MMISVIMPVYNNEKYFPLAVKSITEQDYSDLELIIIDDGSTDQTPFIADELAKGDKRIKVIHQSNQWIYASFNRGIEEASGDYIYIVNSDDRLRKNSLALMAQKAERYHPDIIWTKVLSHECDSEQNITVYDAVNWDRLVSQDLFCRNRGEVRCSWPYFLSTFLAQNQANLYSRKLIGEHRYRNDVYGADALFNISLAPEVETAFVMKEPVYDFFVYKQTGMNASMGRYYPYEHDMFNEIYSKYIELFREWELPEDSYRDLLVGRRLKEINVEIKSLSHPKCAMSIEEKIKYMLGKVPDSIVKECARFGNREEELESRILSGMRMLFVQETIAENSEMYFAYELLESLLRYEKDEEDYEKIERAIDHPLNPQHIGKCFYDKLYKYKETIF